MNVYNDKSNRFYCFFLEAFMCRMFKKARVWKGALEYFLKWNYIDQIPCFLCVSEFHLEMHFWKACT